MPLMHAGDTTKGLAAQARDPPLVRPGVATADAKPRSWQDRHDDNAAAVGWFIVAPVGRAPAWMIRSLPMLTMLADTANPARFSRRAA
jgi:hypothetical protein